MMYESGGEISQTIQAWACEHLDWVYSCDPTVAEDLQAMQAMAEEMGGGWIVTKDQQKIFYVDAEGDAFAPEDAPPEAQGEDALQMFIENTPPFFEPHEDEPPAPVDVPDYLLTTDPKPAAAGSNVWMWAGLAALAGVLIISRGDRS
jgi:hypothetical protein